MGVGKGGGGRGALAPPNFMMHDLLMFSHDSNSFPMFAKDKAFCLIVMIAFYCTRSNPKFL